MPTDDFVEKLKQLGLPAEMAGLCREIMSDALDVVLGDIQSAIDAPPAKHIPAKSAQLSKRKFCPRQACSRCDRQFLSPSQIAQLGPNHQVLDRNAFKERIGSISKDILSNFTFIHVFQGKTAQRGISLPDDEFRKILYKAFPNMLKYDYFRALEPKDKSLQDVRDCHEHGLRYLSLDRGNFDLDNPNEEFFTNYFQPRAQVPPSHHLIADNSHLEIGWSLLAFKMVSAECFVEFSTATTSYCRAVDIASGELHKDLVFSATRAYLLLETQAITYKRLRQLASWILGPEIPPQPQVSWLDAVADTQRATALLNTRLNEVVIPILDGLIGGAKDVLSAYRAHTQDNIKDIQKFGRWLDKTDCPPGKAMDLAFSRHTLRRMRHIAVLQLVRQDFGGLQSAAQGFVKGSVSISEVLTAWESAEESLSILCTLLCRDALESSPYFNHYKYIMYSHYDDWHSIYTCNDRHVSFNDPFAAGSAMLRLLCPGWTMPQKAHTVLWLLVAEGDDCFYDEVQHELVSRFAFIVAAYEALQCLNPCTDTPTDSASLVRKLHSCFEFNFGTDAWSAIVELVPIKQSNPDIYVDILWQQAL